MIAGRQTLIAAATLLALLPASTSAQSLACPLAEDTLVGQAVGSPVAGGIMTDPFNPTQPLDNGPNITACIWNTDDGEVVFVSRQANQFGPGGSTSPLEVAVASTLIPDDVRQEVQNLRDSGVADIQLPTFHLSSVSGMGDAAEYLQRDEPDEGSVTSSFVVQRGVDAFTFGVTADNEFSAMQRARSLAQTLLADLP